jgi:hypothetical protein
MTLDYKKMPKNAAKYICKTCNFECFKQSNYDKHLMTAKHKRMTMNDEKIPKNSKKFICECGKIYKYRQGLHKHKGVCSVINNTIVCVETEEKPSMIEIITQNKELMNLLIAKNNQTDELIQQNREMQKTMLEMVPKIGNNNTTNNTNNNQFNLQVFLNEDCKDAINFSDFIKQIQVSFEDIENQAECGYVKGISKLFIESLKGLGKYKRPIHCTDKKRKTLYIKENDEWDKEGSQDTLKNGIQEVTRSTMKTLIKEKVNRAEEFADMESDFSKQCLIIQRNLIPTAPRETAFSKVMENITKNSGIIE